jgi:hypothetical protein
MAPTIKRPRPARPINKPTSKIVIDQDLSLELVRTVMTATVRVFTGKIFHDTADHFPTRSAPSHGVGMWFLFLPAVWTFYLPDLKKDIPSRSLLNEGV